MFARSSPADPVIVVGAGPAGATAALALASAGIGVRLLDRSAFPRNKSCGGGISARVLERFPYLVRALPRIATHSVSRLHLEGPDGRSAAIDTGGTAALMIRRVGGQPLLMPSRRATTLLTPSAATTARRRPRNLMGGLRIRPAGKSRRPRLRLRNRRRAADSVRIQRYLLADGRRIGQLIDGAHREKAAVGLVAAFVKG